MEMSEVPSDRPGNAEAGPGPSTMAQAAAAAPVPPPMNKLVVPADPEEKAALLVEKESHLAQVVDRHDDMLRELFHLERFVTMVTGYDPALAKQDKSVVFLNYQAERDLVTRFATSSSYGSRSTGRTTRRAFADRKGALALVPPNTPQTIVGKVNDVGSVNGRNVEGNLDHGKGSEKKARQSLGADERKGKRKMEVDSPEPTAGHLPSSASKSHRPKAPAKVPTPGSRVSARVKAVAEIGQHPPSPLSLRVAQGGRKRKLCTDGPVMANGKRTKRSPSPFDPFDRPVPPPRYTDPEQRPNPTPAFGRSLHALMTSFRILEDKDIEETTLQTQAIATARTLNRIRELQNQGRILGSSHTNEDDEKSKNVVAAPFRPPPEPKRLPDHQSHLLTHMAQVSAAVRTELKSHIFFARKMSKAVQAHFDHEKGKDKREQKEEERRKKLVMRDLVKGLKGKWKLAVNVIRAQKVAAAKLEQERLGQAHLQSILDRSSGLIKAHRSHMAGRSGSGSQIEEDDDGENDEDEGDQSVSASSRSEDGTPEHEREGIGDENEDDAMDLLEDSDGATDEEEPAEDSEREDDETGSLDNEAVARESAGLQEQEESAVIIEQSSGLPHVNGNSHAGPEVAPGEVTDTASLQVKVEDTDKDDEEFNAPEADDYRDQQFEVQMEAEEGEVKTDSEDEGLAADADVPIEVLLARYGYGQDVVSAIKMPKTVTQPKANGIHAEQDTDDVEMSASAPVNGTDVEVDGSVRRSGRARKVRQFRDSFSPIAKPPPTTLSEVGSVEASEDEEIEDTFQPTADDAVVRAPFLLRGTLRPYQQAGLEWLAGLYKNKVNGILADEMGLGKTIQTIALLAHLACDKGVWGPHLIVVPTSVILNWEMEFKKFFPGMKVLTYYGNQKERKEKRVGWATENFFQVCITSYQLVLADQHIFRRKNWQYLILDEAHNIKNFRSQRWQTLLGFKSNRRLLLTGTPLQNNLMELWSLMYFLMPNGASGELSEASGFANHREFTEWFSNPMDKAVEAGGAMSDETKATIDRLHTILRPYMLRRLKSEVETQLPGKHEHVIYCKLSKRQRFLYDEFMSRASTRESLVSGGYLGVANCLMQLRKVCNHPDLFEVRPVRTSFAMGKSVAWQFSPTVDLVRKRLLHSDPSDVVDLDVLNILMAAHDDRSSLASRAIARLDATSLLPSGRETINNEDMECNSRTLAGWQTYRERQQALATAWRWRQTRYLNRLRCNRAPVYGVDLLSKLHGISLDLRLLPDEEFVKYPKAREDNQLSCSPSLVHSLRVRSDLMAPIVDRFAVITPNATADELVPLVMPNVDPTRHPELTDVDFDTLHRSTVKLQIAFPDASLLQYDCGKLQVLHDMLKDLKAGGHRVIIFTQMTKMLDILELFLSYNGHRYFRLDGGTKIEDRQRITERFNSDTRIFAFIASTRAGGVGINLTGADTVIFYDADYNVAMDRQAMDRAHRIGQTREVNIYRLVTSHTVEENILRKSNQKRMLDNLVIQEGNFTTDFFGKLDLRDMLGEDILRGLDVRQPTPAESVSEAVVERDRREMERALAEAEDEEDAAAARIAAGEVEMDTTDFETGDRVRSRVGSGSVTPAPISGVDSPGLEQIDDVVTIGEGDEDDEEYDDAEPGSIDEYMLRLVEWDWDYFY